MIFINKNHDLNHIKYSFIIIALTVNNLHQWHSIYQNLIIQLVYTLNTLTRNQIIEFQT